MRYKQLELSGRFLLPGEGLSGERPARRKGRRAVRRPAADRLLLGPDALSGPIWRIESRDLLTFLAAHTRKRS